MKSALPRSAELLEKVLACLGPNRLPLLIGIDGPNGAGKSSLASWLAWQLGAAAIYLDLYVIRGSDPRSDRVATLEEAKAQFQKSWDAWKAWAKLEEVPGES